MNQRWFYGDRYVFRVEDVTSVKYDRLLSHGIIDVTIQAPGMSEPATDTVTGYGGEELMWALRPSAMEGKRFRWRKHAWAIHNLFGHPLMQLLAWMKMYDAAMWIHDRTTPKPLNRN